MKLKRFSLATGVAATLGLFGAGVASANQFVGDLVYCDVGGTRGVYDPDAGDYGIDGVEIAIHCVGTQNTCDVTTTTGAFHASVDLGNFAANCAEHATFDILDPAARNGRYAVNLTRPEACPNPLGVPVSCTVTVNPATLPADCDALVTPTLDPELPVDGNGDGDYCDAEDGPFVEDQILGDNGNDPVVCEAVPSAVLGDAIHEYNSNNPPITTRCSLYADFGYESGEEECVPCIERKKHHDDRDSDSDHKNKKGWGWSNKSSFGWNHFDHADSDSDSDDEPDPSGLPYCPKEGEGEPGVVYCPVDRPDDDHDSDSNHGCKDHGQHSWGWSSKWGFSYRR
jgi:hypothetical protein